MSSPLDISEAFGAVHPSRAAFAAFLVRILRFKRGDEPLLC